MSYTATMKLLFVLVAVLRLDLIFCEGNNNCNMIDCLQEVQDVMKEENPEHICGKLNKTALCFWNCFQGTSYDNVDLYSGLMKLTSEENCEELSVDIVRHGKCLLENKYDIATCFLHSASLLPKTNISDGRQLTCRKLLSSQSCSDIVSPKCGDGGVELIMNLQETLLHKVFQTACSGLQGSVHDLQVVVPHGNKFVKLSDCMANHDDIVKQCWSEHIPMLTTSMNDCRIADKFYNCVTFSLQILCGKKQVSPSKSFFQSLFSFLKYEVCHKGNTTTRYETSTTATVSSALPPSEIKDAGQENDPIKKDESVLSQHLADQSAEDDQVVKHSNLNNTNDLKKHLTVGGVIATDMSLGLIHLSSYPLLIAIFVLRWVI